VRKIEAPTVCPECAGELSWKNDQLYCTNSHCKSRLQKGVEHFAKTLKIKGLGPATIEKLQLESIIGIYELTLDEMVVVLGDKTATKLYDEIEASKEANIEEVLPAFGIPLIGKTAAKKLSPFIKSISDISEEVVKQAGLGPIASKNLLTWLKDEYPKLSELPLKLSVATERVVRDTIGVVCITGKLLSFKTKAEAYEKLEEAGYAVSENLTSKVTILVNESGKESTKTKKAEQLGITIVTNIKDLIK
jgi:DNA ligase (NAD+)